MTDRKPQSLRKGTAVIVRCARGEVRENLVWHDYGDVVMVCSRDHYKRLSEGRASPMPIGFWREDVSEVAARGETKSTRDSQALYHAGE